MEYGRAYRADGPGRSGTSIRRVLRMAGGAGLGLVLTGAAVWTARAANTGVSAIIDARGRVREQTRIFERDLLVADVPRRPAPVGGSFYARHGDLFAVACWLAVAGTWLAARVCKGSAGGGGARDERD